MTDEEKFRFDLSGFLVRPAILERDEVDAIVEQIEQIHHNPDALPPEHRAVPGGPSSVLIDHPKVLDVLHEIIGPDVQDGELLFCLARKGTGTRWAPRWWTTTGVIRFSDIASITDGSTPEWYASSLS